LSYRVLEVVYQAQAGRLGRGIELADLVDQVTRGAISRRIAPDRPTVVNCVTVLVRLGYLRIDRWSKYRLTSCGWTHGLARPRDEFPWTE
jgi:DNA-binding IclR family transcriptional regulator